MQIYASNFDGHPIMLDVLPNNTIDIVKAKVQSKVGIHPEKFRFIFGGKQLENSQTLAYYNIKQESTLFMVLCSKMLRVFGCLIFYEFCLLLFNPISLFMFSRWEVCMVMALARGRGQRTIRLRNIS